MRGGSLAFDPPAHLLQRLAQVKFVVMDVDGTITSPNDRTAQAVAQTLGRLDSAGIGWSFATGRTIAGLNRAASAILGQPRGRAMLPSICYNGGVIFVPGLPSIISIRRMPSVDVTRTLALAKTMGMKALVYSCSNHLGEPLEIVHTSIDAADGPQTEINGMQTVFTGAWEDVDLSSTVSILLATSSVPTEGDLVRMQDLLGGSLRVTTSGACFFEISPANTSKGEALSRLLTETDALAQRHRSWVKFLGLTEGQVMAIGDNYNDADMLLAAGVGVAVANAPATLKHSADFVCSLPAGQGTVEALRYLLDAKRYHRSVGVLKPQ